MGVPDGLAFGVAVGVLVGVDEAFTVVLALGVMVGAADFGVALGAFVCVGAVVAVALEDALVVVVRTEGEGSGLTAGDFEALAVGVGVLEVVADGCGLDDESLVAGEGVAVGEAAESCTGWH